MLSSDPAQFVFRKHRVVIPLTGRRAGAELLEPARAQPLLEHHQAEQELVIVLPAGLVTFEECSHGFRVKQTKHKRPFIQEHFPKRSVE